MAPAARQAPLVLTPNRERLGSRLRSHLACSVVTGIITRVPSLTVHALSRTKVFDGDIGGAPRRTSASACGTH